MSKTSAKRSRHLGTVAVRHVDAAQGIVKHRKLGLLASASEWVYEEAASAPTRPASLWRAAHSTASTTARSSVESPLGAHAVAIHALNGGSVPVRHPLLTVVRGGPVERADTVTRILRAALVAAAKIRATRVSGSRAQSAERCSESPANSRPRAASSSLAHRRAESPRRSVAISRHSACPLVGDDFDRNASVEVEHDEHMRCGATEI